ncbi:MAG: FAD-dependent oxidoreductase, partial [Candidatus Competibacterales bacterium]
MNLHLQQSSLQDLHSVDLVVAGAGAAGLACAIEGARRGARVILVEKSPRLGGTVAQALIHTLGGLYAGDGTPLNQGLPLELAERLLASSPHTSKRQMGKLWTLSVDPQHYEAHVTQWLAEYPGITVQRRCQVVECHAPPVADRRRIDTLTLALPTGQRQRLSPRGVVDCTGSAALVRQLDPTAVGSGSAAAGLILRLRGAAPGCLDFPHGVALQRRLRKAVAAGQLPPPAPPCGPTAASIPTRSTSS